jgi:hypothetical protein
VKAVKDVKVVKLGLGQCASRPPTGRGFKSASLAALATPLFLLRSCAVLAAHGCACVPPVLV